MANLFSSLPRPLAALGLLLATAGAAHAQTPATFGPATTYPTRGTYPRAVVVADVNGDGQPDLLTANSYSDTVGVLLGTGSGTFGAVATYPTRGSYPYGLAVADVNGDGYLDIVTANNGISTASVLLGTGTGTFGIAAAFDTGGLSHPYAIAVADVNGDGKPDLLTANGGNSTAGVLLGTGTGFFGKITTFRTGGDPYGLAVADVNGDGQLDLLTANHYGNTVGVLLGTGTGSFGAVTQFSTGAGSLPTSLAVADVNGDGQLDLLTANNGNGTAGVLLGTGTGSFGAATTFGVGAGSSPNGIAVADVNGDSQLDLLTANQGTNSAGVLLGTGTGSFGAVTQFSTGAGSQPISLAVADVNGDSQPDLLTANYGTNTAGVLLNTAVFTPSLTTAAVSNLAATSATLGGTLTSTGSSPLTDYGVVYVAGTGLPTTSDTKLPVGTSAPASLPSPFSAAATGLLPGTTYTYRAYATNRAGTGYGNAVTFIPTGVLISRVGSSLSNAGSVSYTVTFAAPVTGLTAANFALAATGTVAGASITGVSGAGTTYTVAVSTGTGDGTLGLNLATTAGLSPGFSTTLPFLGPAYTLDKTAPTVTITSPTAPNGGYATTSPLTFVITFSEAVTGYDSNDVAAALSNAAGSTLVPNSATSYTLTVTPASAGAVALGVPANAARDAAGNGNAAAPSAYTIFSNVPTAAPAITAPANNSTTTTSLPTYAGTAPAGSTVTVYVNGTSIGTTPATGGSFSLPQPTALPNGAYTVYATAQLNGQLVSAASSPAAFTVATALTVTMLSPAIGPVGTQVTISGTNLGGATAVRFNGTAASSFVVNSPTSITATVAAGSTTGLVTVTAPGGTAASPTSFVVRVPPTTVADAYTTQQGVLLTGNVLTNDIGTNPRAILIIRPTHGVLVLNPSGSFTYQPAAGYSGPDSFIYYACDIGTPLLCGDPVTVSITVVRVAPVTVIDSYNILQDMRLTGNVLTNDLGTNPRAILIIRPTHGTLVLNPDGSFSYQPAAGYVGQDSFIYYACDPGLPLLCGDPATVAITIFPATSARVAAISARPAATATKPGAEAPAGAASSSALALTGSPNPFSEQLRLSFALPTAQAYSLALYDAQGRLVQQLASGQAEAGQAQQVEVPTHTYAAGLYLVRLTTAAGTQLLKLIKQ